MNRLEMVRFHLPIPKYCISKYIGDVAKLADALDLGSSARKGVRVRFPPSPPK